MARNFPETSGSPLGALPLGELLHSLVRGVAGLVSAEADLARAEAEADLQARVRQAREAAIAAVACLIGVNAVLVAAIFVLSVFMVPWLAALIVATPFLAAAGVFAARVRGSRLGPPLKTTRRSLEEDVEWIRSFTTK